MKLSLPYASGEGLKLPSLAPEGAGEGQGGGDRLPRSDAAPIPTFPRKQGKEPLARPSLIGLSSQNVD
jgi:hypothetical protein